MSQTTSSADIIIGAFIPGCGSAAPSAVDFKALEDELTTLQPTDMSLAEFSKSAVFTRLLKQGDRAFLNEMARQPTMPYVSAAGVLSLQNKFPEDAFPAAMDALSSAERPFDIPWGYSVKYLQSAPAPKDEIFILAFEKIAAKKIRSQIGFCHVGTSAPRSLD